MGHRIPIERRREKNTLLPKHKLSAMITKARVKKYEIPALEVSICFKHSFILFGSKVLFGSKAGNIGSVFRLP